MTVQLLKCPRWSSLRLASIIINPRRACAARVTVLGLSVCVCVCVYDYSRSVGNETAYERYQRVQCHAGLIFKMAIFVQVLRSKVMA